MAVQSVETSAGLLVDDLVDDSAVMWVYSSVAMTVDCSADDLVEHSAVMLADQMAELWVA